MYSAIKDQLQHELDEIRTAGLFKTERHIDSPQASHITAGQIGESGADGPELLRQQLPGPGRPPGHHRRRQGRHGRARLRHGQRALHLRHPGPAPGTGSQRVSKFLGTEDTILFSSCFDANGGVFESLFGPEDAIISDALNHASIIDGIRLCKAQRFRYANQDMADLEAKLIEATTQENPARRKIIVTDGVFSMDGYLAPLEAICDLAEKYDALVMVDDSHAVGFMGATGAGTPEHAGVSRPGGHLHRHVRQGPGRRLRRLRLRPRAKWWPCSARRPAPTCSPTRWPRPSWPPRSRPWTWWRIPANCARKLFANAELFRSRMAEEGFELLDGEHAIVPVMFGDAVMAAKVADAMLHNGVFVTAFSYPVVPKGAARIRVQLSAAHSADDVEACVQAFVRQPRRGGRVLAPVTRRDGPDEVQGWRHVSKLRCRDCGRRHCRAVPCLRPGRQMQRGAGRGRTVPGVPHLSPLGPAADPQLRARRWSRS